MAGAWQAPEFTILFSIQRPHPIGCFFTPLSIGSEWFFSEQADVELESVFSPLLLHVMIGHRACGASFFFFLHCLHQSNCLELRQANGARWQLFLRICPCFAHVFSDTSC